MSTRSKETGPYGKQPEDDVKGGTEQPAPVGAFAGEEPKEKAHRHREKEGERIAHTRAESLEDNTKGEGGIARMGEDEAGVNIGGNAQAKKAHAPAARRPPSPIPEASAAPASLDGPHDPEHDLYAAVSGSRSAAGERDRESVGEPGSAVDELCSERFHHTRTVPLAALIVTLAVLAAGVSALVAFLVFRSVSSQSVASISVALRRNTCLGAAEYLQRKVFAPLVDAMEHVQDSYMLFAAPVGAGASRDMRAWERLARRWMAVYNATGVEGIGVGFPNGEQIVLRKFTLGPASVPGRLLFQIPDPSAPPGRPAVLSFLVLPSGDIERAVDVPPNLFEDRPFNETASYRAALAAAPSAPSLLYHT
eukprot:tig00021037_g17445.t1